jgi:hypothetical protein
VSRDSHGSSSPRLDKYTLPALGAHGDRPRWASVLGQVLADLPERLSDTSKRSFMMSLSLIFSLVVEVGLIKASPMKVLKEVASESQQAGAIVPLFGAGGKARRRGQA